MRSKELIFFCFKCTLAIFDENESHKGHTLGWSLLSERPFVSKKLQVCRHSKSVASDKNPSVSLAHTARFLSLRTKTLVAGDVNLLCAGNTYKRFLSLTTIFNIKYVRNSFSSLMTEDKISVASDKIVLCALGFKKPFLQMISSFE